MENKTGIPSKSQVVFLTIEYVVVLNRFCVISEHHYSPRLNIVPFVSCFPIHFLVYMYSNFQVQP